MSTIAAAATESLVVILTLTKDQFDAGLDDRTLTAEEWTAVAREIQGRLDTYIDEVLLTSITEDVNDGLYDQ